MIRRFARMMLADLRGPRVPGTPVEGERRALLHSIRRVALVFSGVWQLAMILVTVGMLGLDGSPLVLAEAALGAAAFLALRFRRLDAAIPPAMAAIGLWALVAGGDVDSALVFAAIWQVNFAGVIAGLLLLRRSGAPAAAAMAVAVASGVLWLLPGWGLQLPVVIAVTLLSITVAVKWGLVTLVGIADEADASAAEAAEAHRRTLLAERVSAQMAEESRVLHDTAINTLGAIASGGAGAADAGRVREQCARDVALLRILRTRPSSLTPESLLEVFHQPGLPIVRRGADDAELERWESAMPASTVAAVVRCVREAVTNAAKHSGADQAVVEAVASDAALTVTVSDSGVGFSPEAVAEGLGVGASIMERARDNGFAASVESAPGRGTTVRIEVGRDAEAPPPSSREARPPAAALHTRAGELWGIGVTAVSVVLAVSGSANGGLALYPMIGIMLAAWLAYRLAPSLRGRAVFLAALAVSAAAVFVLAAAATGFGTSGAIHWHALAPTGPFVLLLSATPRARARIPAAALWAAVAVALAVAVHPVSPTAAVIVLIACGVGLGFSGVWAVFLAILGRLGEQAAASRRALTEAAVRAGLDAAAQQGYRRWVGAGLDSAIELLRGIAEGDGDPRSPATRDACAEEERYLRQLVELSPRLVNLSRELPQTLSLARAREVSYVLRLGEADAPDDETARGVADSITETLAGLRPGEALRASLYPVREGLQLTLLGPRIRPPRQGPGRARHQSLGAVELLEVAYPRATAGTTS